MGRAWAWGQAHLVAQEEIRLQRKRPRFNPRVRRSPGEGKGSPLHYSCLENSMDRGAWWPTVHGVINSRTRLRDSHFHFTHLCLHPGPYSWKAEWYGKSTFGPQTSFLFCKISLMTAGSWIVDFSRVDQGKYSCLACSRCSKRLNFLSRVFSKNVLKLHRWLTCGENGLLVFHWNSSQNEATEPDILLHSKNIYQAWNIEWSSS